MNSLFIFRRVLSMSEKRYRTLSISSSSSSRDIYPIMKKLIDTKQYKKAIDIFDEKFDLCKDLEIDLVLKACLNLNEYQCAINIQQKLSQNSLNNPYIQTSLIQLYIQHHDINNAYRLFLKITNKSISIYTTMIKGLILNNMLDKVLDLFDEIKIQPNEIMLTMLFDVCARLDNDRAKQTGKKILNEMSEKFLNDSILLNSAIIMLMKFGDVKSAEDLFHKIKNKNIINYGAMMKGYTLNNMCDKALDLFEQIESNHSNISYTIIFNACAQL
ncbi:unnamed protein product, partial [Adineta steineri]